MSEGDACPAEKGASALPAQASPPPASDRASLSVNVTSDAPSESGYQRLIERLIRVEIENYRGFRGRFELDFPDGCNLLVYGENGAGKSSLFHALNDFFESPTRTFYDEGTQVRRQLKHDDYRHRFNADPACIRLVFSLRPSISGVAQQPKPYEWSASKDDPQTPEMRALDKGKGCLDYRSLLRVHLLPVGDRNINLFELFITLLLAHYKNPASTPSLTFIEEWTRIKTAFRPYVRKPAALDNWISEFNAGFERVAADTVTLASTLLSEFDKELAFSVEFTPASYEWSPKRLVAPTIVARPSFLRMLHSDYYTFLNEARLSALAITLYFAGLKNSPIADFRLLVLDDILIGLDMANRLTVLRIVREQFKDWQVFIFTYHKAWFEILKEETKRWGAPWKSVVLRSESVEDGRAPFVVVEGSGDLLTIASNHLQHKDYKAAAVYARSALEKVCHETCAKAQLQVLHVKYPKERKLEHYLEAIEDRLAQLSNHARRAGALQIVERLRQARAFVLNRKSHFDAEEEDTLSAEVGAAIQVVRDLEKLFKPDLWKHSNFNDGQALSPAERMRLELAEAREFVLFNQHRDEAIKKMKVAHELAWEIYGSREKVCLPIGEQLTAKVIWDAASAQIKLDAELNERLKKARPYLFGNIEADQFDATEFESAAKLLEEIAAQPAHVARQQKEKWSRLRYGLFSGILNGLERVLAGYSKARSVESIKPE
jgi:energy-coupling factor transporter ATP-binding protein EcfA2